MAEIEVTGWTRTALLAVGAGAGVLVMAGLLHLAKEWGLIR
jgi:hypothetical protein